MENLKQLWQQYDSQLKATQATNELLLRKMMEERSSDQAGRMLNLEYLNLSVYALMLLVLLCTPHLMGSTTQVWIAYFCSILFMLVGLCYTVYKIRILNHFDPGNVAVTDSIKRMQDFRLLLQREKIVAFLVLPFVLAALIIVAHQLRYGNSALGYLRMYAWRLAVAYPIAVFLTVWLYRRYYFRNIKSILQNLTELQQFKSS